MDTLCPVVTSVVMLNRLAIRPMHRPFWQKDPMALQRSADERVSLHVAISTSGRWPEYHFVAGGNGHPALGEQPVVRGA